MDNLNNPMLNGSNINEGNGANFVAHEQSPNDVATDEDAIERKKVFLY